MSDDEDHHVTTTPPKRRYNRLPPLSNIITPGNVAFRLLCPVSSSGAIIGKSGTIVKLLEKETGSKIRIENPVSRCDDRIITVVAPEFPKKTISLKSSNHVDNYEDKEEIGEEIEVSPVQHGLIRVFERVLEVEEEIEEMFPTTGVGVGLVVCRMLGHDNQIGYLMGHGGTRIKKMENDSGARVRVYRECPSCASPTDQLVQIKGDSLAVKKAALAVLQCFHDSPHLCKTQMVGSWPIMAGSNGAFADPYTSFLPHKTSFVSPGVSSSLDYASRSYSIPGEEEVVFRLVCSDDRIGGVIGKGGSIVKAIQDETGASIFVATSVTGSDDRVIHVSAFENVESEYSPAQNALVRVFTRSVEIGYHIMQESGTNGVPKVDARLLVPIDQIGCLIGRGGTIVSEMRKATHTGMWVLQGDEVPPCAAENDAVIRINGWPHNVQAALFLVARRLRDTFFPQKKINAARRTREPISSDSYPSADLSQNLSQQASLTKSMHRLGLSHPLNQSLSPTLCSTTWSGEKLRGYMDTGRGALALSGGLEHGSASKSAIVKSTILEILVPVHALGSAFEEKESNLSRLRQISGAQVMVHEPFPGSSEVTIIISGTPNQTRAAQSVLHAFTLGSK